MPGRPHVLDQLIGVDADLDGEDVDARNHHIVGRQVPQVQDVGKHHPLVVADRGVRGLVGGALLDLLDDLLDALAQLRVAVSVTEECQHAPEGRDQRRLTSMLAAGARRFAVGRSPAHGVSSERRAGPTSATSLR